MMQEWGGWGHYAEGRSTPSQHSEAERTRSVGILSKYREQWDMQGGQVEASLSLLPPKNSFVFN